MTPDSLGSRFWGELKLSLRRVARSDFQLERASEAERRELQAAPRAVTSPVVQDYAAWRRSTLWVAAVALLVHALFEVVGHQSLAQALPPEVVYALGPQNIALVDWLARSILIVLVLGSVLVLAAALAWRRPRSSVLLARTGWALMFVTPFILAALPIARLLSLDHLAPQVAEGLRQGLGGAFAMSFFFSVGPRAVALFPGVIRSSLTVKTLLPESSGPGWAVMIVGPLYSIFLLVLVTGIIQAQGSFILLGGVLCLMLSPVVYLVRWRDLIRPQGALEAARLVTTTRRVAGALSLAGIALLGVFILRLPKLDVLNLFGFLTGVLGNVILLMVVGADFILAVLRAAHQQSEAFLGSDLHRALGDKLGALADAGVSARPAAPSRDPPRAPSP